MGKYALVIEGKLKAVVKDKDGRIVQTHEQEMHSFTRNFVNFLASLFVQPEPLVKDVRQPSVVVPVRGRYPVVDTAGATKSITYVTWEYTVDAALIGLAARDHDSRYGILVGSGTRPFHYSDATLEIPYTEGVGAGQLDHGPTVVEDPVIAVGSSTIRLWRTFINYYSQPQTVSESALVARNHVRADGTILQEAHYLIARDVWTTPVNIPSLGALTVYYTITITT